MPDQLTLFDLPPASQDAPGRAQPARATKDTAPAPRGAPAPRASRQATPEDPMVLRARRAAEQAAALAGARGEHQRRCAAYPAPRLPARTVQALVRVGVSYVGSYLAQEGDASGAGTALHVVEGLFKPASGRTLLTKTADGVQALLDSFDLPDDLLAGGFRRYGHPAYITALGQDGEPGVTCALPTLEENIAAAREMLAERARIRASEAERQARQAARQTRKKKARVA